MEKVKALSKALIAKSPWTNGHAHRVMRYAIAVGQEMKLGREDLNFLRMACLLHDIGKIKTCAKILEKTGKLTAFEFEQVKKHPVKGAEMVMEFRDLDPGVAPHVAPVIRFHHERYDGNGYPDGLKGEEIPLLSRILFVADAFDSMTADRPYRKAPGMEYAIYELLACAGTQFDPGVVHAFLKIVNKLSVL
jgi:putative nucleotidyltransferase with HDIG domain